MPCKDQVIEKGGWLLRLMLEVVTTYKRYLAQKSRVFTKEKGILEGRTKQHYYDIIIELKVEDVFHEQNIFFFKCQDFSAENIW